MKKLMMAALVLIMFTVLAACGSQDESAGGSDDKSNEEEKLTPQQVIKKSSEEMNSWPGMHYIIDGKQTINASKGDQTKKFNQEFSLETKMTMDSITFHMTGDMTTQGKQVPVESYYVDSTLYTKTPQKQWIAIKGMNLDKVQKQSQGQNPSKLMKQFTKILDELSGEEKSNEYISMKEKDNMYVVELDLNEEALKKVMDIVMEQAKGTFEQMEKMGIPNVMENMKITSMKQTFYIDKKSFEQKKVDQQMTMEMSKNGANMTIDTDMSIDIKGQVDEKITVPTDIKDKARAVNMNQLQKGQQKVSISDSEGTKQAVVGVHKAFHELSKDVEQKIKQAEKEFNKYVNGKMSKKEFDKVEKKVKDFISKKRSELDEIEKPTNKTALTYYKLSKNTMTGMLDLVGTLVSVPDLSKKQALNEYSKTIQKETKEAKVKAKKVKTFQNKLMELNKEYKKVFKGNN